jgi:uncharacterized protein (UPF0216 family)
MFYHVPNINCILHTFKNIYLKHFKPIIKEIYFERLNIIIIEIFKFQKNCIYMHGRSHINITSFELFDLEIIIYVKFMKINIYGLFDMVGTSQIL